MARPCEQDHEPRYVPGEPFDPKRDCRLCWLYVNDERYRKLWDADSTQPEKPKTRKKCQCFEYPPGCRGPGTILKSFLTWFDISKGKKGCGKCKGLARKMDCCGPAKCQENFDTILGWLRESAAERSFPFVEVGARIAIQWAIDLSRKELEMADSSPTNSAETLQ